jgi:hypothetical protein
LIWPRIVSVAGAAAVAGLPGAGSLDAEDVPTGIFTTKAPDWTRAEKARLVFVGGEATTISAKLVAVENATPMSPTAALLELLRLATKTRDSAAVAVTVKLRSVSGAAL